MQEAQVTTQAPPRVLIVEDDALIRKLLRALFEDRGLALEFAETYKEAAAAIESSEPRMVILDLGLPDGDGLDLLRHFREHLRRTEPVLVLTAFRAEEKAVEAFQHGANDFVTKPFSPRELSDRVHSVLTQ